jgi:Effector-associated domain 11
MNMTNDIKKLISDGDTQEAIDAIQELLQGRNDKLLNQTYLLESQYKELQSKIRLGIQSEAAEINRITMSLLSICDDIENLKDKPKPVVTVKEEIPWIQKPMVKYGGLGLIALILIVFLMKGCMDDTTDIQEEDVPVEQNEAK